jgi:SET domain-containing protein
MTSGSQLYEVCHSPIHGTGVFATRKIKKGTWIVEYTGERISHEEADRRYDDDAMPQHHTFLFTLDDRECIDASVDGSDARYINHSCDPNCEAVWVPREREIWIVALRDIAKGEELSYDYAYELDEDVERARAKYPCRCGAPDCRGTIMRTAF